MPHRLWVRIVLVIALAGAFAWSVADRAHVDLGTVERNIHSAGAWAPAAYILVYVLATVIFLPGSILSLAGCAARASGRCAATSSASSRRRGASPQSARRYKGNAW